MPVKLQVWSSEKFLKCQLKENNRSVHLRMKEMIMPNLFKVYTNITKIYVVLQ